MFWFYRKRLLSKSNFGCFSHTLKNKNASVYQHQIAFSGKHENELHLENFLAEFTFSVSSVVLYFFFLSDYLGFPR